MTGYELHDRDCDRIWIMMKALVLVAALLGRTAVAGTVHGDKAAALTQALRYAGVKPTTAKGTRTFHVAAISCLRMLEGDEVLGDHKCTLDKSEIKDVGAYVLYEAMSAAGLLQTVVTETHIKTVDANLTCMIDATKQVQCTSDGIQEKPAEIKITPKKRKIKDIVQPVKIEKQGSQPEPE